MKEAKRLFFQKSYRRALESFLSLQVEEHDYPELSYYLGLCYTHLEKYEEALLYLEQVVSSDLDILRVYQSRMILGYIYAITGRYRLAEFEFARVLEDGFESAKVYSALSYVLYYQRKMENSLSKLEKALEIDKNNANALNSAGYILAENNQDLDRALSYCKRAISIQPNNPAYLDSLGWVHFKSGNIEDARECLRKALELRPGESEIVKHLKAVMKKSGERT